MDSPIDPVNQGSEYVGLPKVDPWHESEKHRKKRFAKMLEDSLEDQKQRREEKDEVELSSEASDNDDSDNQAPETPAAGRPDSTHDDNPPPPAHIDVKG